MREDCTIHPPPKWDIFGKTVPTVFGSLHVSVATARSPLNKTQLTHYGWFSATKLNPKELLFGTVKRLLTVWNNKSFLELNNRFVVWKLFGFRNRTWTDLSTFVLRCQTLCFRNLEVRRSNGYSFNETTSGPVTQQLILGNFEFSENASFLVEDGMF